MPVTVITSTPNNGLNTISSSKSSVLYRGFYNRLSPDVKNLLQTYPSISYIGDFLSEAWSKSDNMPPESRAVAARIAHALSKAISGLEYELPSNITILGEIHLAQTKALVFNMEEWMIQNLSNATKGSDSIGAAILQIGPDGYSALQEIEQWQLFEEIFYNKVYYSPFIIDHKIVTLLTNVQFQYAG